MRPSGKALVPWACVALAVAAACVPLAIQGKDAPETRPVVQVAPGPFWSLPPGGSYLKPVLGAAALVSSQQPFVLGPMDSVEMTWEQRGQTVFHTKGVRERDGFAPFIVQSLGPGELNLTMAMAGQASIRSSMVGFDVPNPPRTAEQARHHLGSTWTYDATKGDVTLRRDYGTRGLVDLTDSEGRLLLSAWARNVAATPADDPDFHIHVDPAYGNLHVRAYVTGSLGLGMAETTLPAPVAGTPTVPDALAEASPDVGACEEWLRFDPPASDLRWSWGTAVQVSFVDALHLSHGNERHIQYTLERSLVSGGGNVFSWTSHDAWGTATIRPPAPGLYLLVATEDATTRCQRLLTFEAGAAGQSRLELKVNATAPWTAVTNQTGRLEVGLKPTPAPGAASYDVRVVQLENGNATARLVWAGRLASATGEVTFTLGGLRPGPHVVTVHPSMEASGVAPFAASVGAPYEVRVNVPEPVAPVVAPTPTTTTPGFTLGVSLVAVVLLGRRFVSVR